jgi:putative hydrolase of the HAD superfamily
MNTDKRVTTLLIDVGGVLLTNGFDHEARKLACATFGLDPPEMEERHGLAFEASELGRLTMDEYLSLVVFHEKRSFTRSQFKKFVFAQSQPFPEMIALMRRLKAKYGLKVGVVSNESRDLNAYRIKTFKLDAFVDFFITSCYVHVRKPDPEIVCLALDIGHVAPARAVYVDDRAMFVQVAEMQGIRGIHHTDYETTRNHLSGLGLAAE